MNDFVTYGPSNAAAAFPSYRGIRIRGGSFLLPTGGARGIDRSATHGSAI
jgi:hypothetical protein